MTNKSTYKDILKNIKELKSRDIVSVYLPTSGNTVDFTPLTVKQQKQILSSGVDTEVENLTFANITNDIIKENALSKSDILVSDKPLILLQLRRHAVGNELVVEEGEEKYTIDLDTHISQCTRLGHNETTFQFTHDVITVTGSIPDLSKDTIYNKQFTKNVKKGNTKLKLNDVIGDIYITELVKYVDSISINGESIADGQDVSAANMIEIFENLPLQVSTRLADNVKELRHIENTCVTSSILPEDVNIPVNANIFTATE